MGIVVLFALLWALVEFIGIGAHVPVEQIVFTRYATHLLTLLLLFGPTRKVALARSRRPYLQLGRSLLMLGMPLSYIAAVVLMPVKDALVVFWIVPLAGLAWVRSSHKRWVWMAGCIAYAGVFLVTGGGVRVLHWAALFAVAMGFCFTAYLFLTERLSDDSTPTNLFHTAFWVFLALSFRMPFVWQWPSGRAWIVLTAVGVIGLIALYTLDLAIRLDGPIAFIPALYLQPVFFHLLEDGPAGFGKRSTLGAVLILIGIAVAAIQRRKDAPMQPLHPIS